MRKAKHVVSLLLCVIMCITLLPAGAFAADGVAISTANFPDSTFRKYVRTFDKDKDGSLSSTEIAAAKEIELYSKGISNLKGVEYFTALKELDCWGNKLTSLDLSKNKKLTVLFCADNQLTSLNISGCAALKYLTCERNQLKSLDVSKNTKLATLNCNNNKLTSLNLSNNPMLSNIQCADNNIGKINLQNCPLLIHAVKKGEKQTMGQAPDLTVYYSMSQSAGDIPVIYSVWADASTVLQTGSVNPPVIKTEPRNKSVAVGKTVTFTVKAAGGGLTYQWYVVKETYGEKIKLSGKTSASLSFTVKASQKGYRYFCVVSNKGGATYTAAAKLSVLTTPKITTQPASKTVNAGEKASFKVKASGGGLKYQWYYQKPGTSKWVKIAENATAATYSLTAKKSLNGYKYRCKITNAAGSAVSKAARLTVK